MNLEQLRRIMVTIMDDHSVIVHVSPEQFSRLLHYNSLKHFKRKLGLPEQYAPGMPMPKEAYEITQKITEDLRIFKCEVGWDITSPIEVNQDTGEAEYPEDYYIVGGITYFYVDSAKKKTYERKVDVLSDLEFIDRSTDTNEKPTKFFPICNIRKGKIFVKPYDLVYINMMYLRLPNEPKYMTLPNQRYQKYDSDNSVQLEWDEINQLDIMAGVMADLGVKLDDQNVQQYAEKIKQTGT